MNKQTSDTNGWSPTELWHRWPAIEHTTRLVFDRLGDLEEHLIHYYLSRGEPFVVVMR